MNPIDHALHNITYQIPEEILNVAFNIDLDPSLGSITTTKEKIEHFVIRNRVLIDCNIVSGQETLVNLASAQVKTASHMFTIYFVPPELTMNRKITSVLSIMHVLHHHTLSSYPIHHSGLGVHNDNALVSVGHRIGNAAADVAPFTNTTCEIVGHNLVLVHANFRILTSAQLRCTLENDADYQNLSIRSYRNFSELCVWAVKSFIYNKLAVKLDSGFLSFGKELGRIREFVDEYREAEEAYRTYLREVFSGVTKMNDSITYSRFLKSMINPGL